MAKAVAMTEDKKWKVESDLHTLLEAKEIQKDSKRMADVRKLAKEKAFHLETLAVK